MKAINSSKESRRFFCQLFDGELNKYIMQMDDQYFQRNPEARQNPRILRQNSMAAKMMARPGY